MDGAPGIRLRRAGHGTAPDGALVRWSVAEGARGRRWRWVVLDGARIRSVALLELDADGRFGRLELETSVATLTLHPEPDHAYAHGNVVRSGGVEPIALAWAPDRGLLISGDAFGSALCAGQGSRAVIGHDGSVLVVDDRDLERVTGVEVDTRGIPRLAAGAEWPLEV